MKAWPKIGYEFLEDGLQGLWSPALTGATDTTLRDLNKTTRNDGTLTSPLDKNTSWVGDAHGTIVSTLAGGTVRIANSSSVNLTGTITQMVWIRYFAGQGSRGIFCKAGDFGQYGIFTDTSVNTRLRFSVWSGATSYNAITTRSYADGLWHLVCGIYNKNNVIINIDGGSEIVVGTAYMGDVTATTQGLWFGAFTNGGGAFNGLFSEAMLHSRAFSHEEVALYYNAGPNNAWSLEPPRKRSYFAQVTTFKNYWFRNQQRMIGGGVR